jgi:PTH2 family peptidyl-tRNA hydrolase
VNPVMYIFANRGLKMSPGKLAAQCCHAAIEAYIVSDDDMIRRWRHGGHYTKIILQAEDEQQMANIEQYLQERGFKTKQIIDEGRTEVRPFSRTALGVAIVDKDKPHVAESFSEFRTYKPLPEDNVVLAKNRLHAVWLILKESLASPRTNTLIRFKN